MERFSIKIAPKHIIFDYSWDKKETNKLFRLVCLFCPPSRKKIFKNFVFVYNFRFDYGTIGHGKYFSVSLNIIFSRKGYRNEIFR